MAWTWTIIQDDANNVSQAHCNYRLLIWSIHWTSSLETSAQTWSNYKHYKFLIGIRPQAAFLLYHKHGEAVCLMYILLRIVECWTNVYLAILYWQTMVFWFRIWLAFKVPSYTKGKAQFRKHEVDSIYWWAGSCSHSREMYDWSPEKFKVLCSMHGPFL